MVLSGKSFKEVLTCFETGILGNHYISYSPLFPGCSPFENQLKYG